MKITFIGKTKQKKENKTNKKQNSKKKKNKKKNDSNNFTGEKSPFKNLDYISFWH